MGYRGLLIGLWLLAGTAMAAEVDVDLGLAIGISSFNVTGLSQGTTEANKITSSFAVLPDIKLFSWFSVETGLLYYNRTLGYDGRIFGTPVNNTIRTQHLELPVMGRFHFLHDYLSGGAGLFVACGVGDVNEERSVGGVAATVVDQTYEDSGIPAWEYGIAAGLQGKFPVTDHLKLFLDARYQLGLSQWNTVSQDSRSINTFRFLFGASVAL